MPIPLCADGMELVLCFLGVVSHCKFRISRTALREKKNLYENSFLELFYARFASGINEIYFESITTLSNKFTTAEGDGILSFVAK